MTARPRKFGGRPSAGRKIANRAPRARVLLVLGGKTTEVEYFAYVKHSLRASAVDIEVVAEGWNPARLLEHAESLMERDRKQAKRSGDPLDVYDFVWVVIDVDETAEEIRRIAPLAARSKVVLVVSNPCFEIWPIIHVEELTRPMERGELQTHAKNLGVIDRRNGKSIVVPKLAGNFAVSESRAQELRRRHDRSGAEFPHNCPSTDVDLVVRQLIDSSVASNPGITVEL